MNKENMAVLTNIIAAVETGGQVYGKKRYGDYTPPYKNTPNEHTITLGFLQAYGDEARKLIRMIFEADPEKFRQLDTCNPSIESMLNKDWVGMRWNPFNEQKKVLIALINSEVGHKAQDELFAQLMQTFISDCEAAYTSEIGAVMMYCEIRHLGGKKAADRIFNRCAGVYSLDAIMSALKQDQNDYSSNNQVGDSKFWSRHQKCVEFIKRYAVIESDTDMNTETAVNKKRKESTMTPLQRAKVLLRQPQSETMTGYTPDGKSYFVYADAWTHEPKKGDVIYFYSSSKGRVGHVGIVESVDKAAHVVHTIEGNTSSNEYAENGGCVARHSYNYSQQGGTNRVNGFGRPDFAGAGVTADQFVKTAIGELGYLEKRSNKDLDSKTANAGSNNYQKYQRDVGAGNGDQWCQFFVDGCALYCCQGNSHTEPATTLNENTKWIGVINKASTNCRTWAGAENPTVSFSPLALNTEVGVCDELNDSKGQKWYYILLNGKHGFVKSSYVSRKKKKTIRRKLASTVFTAAIKSVADKARTEHWTYGDSHSSVPCADGKISCDRLIARALYDMGFRDQRAGGEVCSTLPGYLEKHGWTKVSKKKQIKPGAVVAVRDKSHSYIDHVFFAARYNPTTDKCTKYDCGSNERIHTVQPFRNVPLVEWKNKTFVCAWNPPAYLSNGKPGRFIYEGVDYSPVFNSIYYRRMNPEVAKVCKSRSDLFNHFVNFGMSEGRQGCASFNVWSYKEAHPELKYDLTKSYYREYCLNGG